MSPVLLTVVMLAAFACLIGGVMLVLRGSDRRKGLLMLVMAVVLIGNVAVWVM